MFNNNPMIAPFPEPYIYPSMTILNTALGIGPLFVFKQLES